MIATHSILAPVDLSRAAEEDIRYAHGLAGELRAHLHLLYVAGAESSPDFARWPADLLSSHGCVRRTVLHGDVAETIAEHAESMQADLVLLSSRRYGRWNRFWRKSVAEEVMRLSSRPICIVPEKAASSRSPQQDHRILCVVGLDGTDTALVRHTADLAATIGSEIVMLHVVPEPTEALLYHAADQETRPLSRERAAADLDRLAASFGLAPVTSVMIGRPDKCIALAVREHSADLVVVSRSGRGLPAAYDSHLENILRELHCPMLTVPLELSAPTDLFDGRRVRSASHSPVGSAVSALTQHVEIARQLDPAGVRKLDLFPSTSAGRA